MDFYIIELKDRIKIGISTDVEKRLIAILSTGGHGRKDVLNLFKFKSASIIEAPLKRLFIANLIEKCDINRGNEWFYKKGLVEVFINEIRLGTKPTIDIIDKIQYKHSLIENGFKQEAVFIYERIIKERKGVGFPKSVTFEKFLKSKEMDYRNMIYLINDDYTEFTRKPKFYIEDIKDSQGIELLRIIKNNTISANKQEKIQSYIDDIFNKKVDSSSKIIEIIEKYFFKSIKVQKVENPNIRIEFNKENNNYKFKMPYSKLTAEEYLLIKESKIISLFENKFSIQYKFLSCYCEFDSKEISRVRNLLKNGEYKDFTGDEIIRNSTLQREPPIKKYRPMKKINRI